MPAVSEGGEVHTRMCQFDVFINNRISSILFYNFSSVEVNENVQIVLLDSFLDKESSDHKRIQTGNIEPEAQCI
jgi:hypothetical protein